MRNLFFPQKSLANSEIFPNLHRKTQYHEENENKQHHIYHEIARLYEHLEVEKTSGR